MSLRHLLGIATSGSLVSLLAVLGTSAALAGSGGPKPGFSVTITNLTANQVISPPIVASHDADADVFEVGTPASAELAALAENGDNAPLRDLLTASENVLDVVALSDPLMPGQSVTVSLAVKGRFNLVSAAGMLVSSNDAFFGLDGEPVAKNRPLVVLVPAYDAGSEANSEDCAYVPGPPCGAGPVHDPSPAEGFVHIGNGIRGIGGVPADVYDWSNPVARIVIERL